MKYSSEKHMDADRNVTGYSERRMMEVRNQPFD